MSASALTELRPAWPEAVQSAGPRLRRLNLAMGGLHLVQGVLMLALSTAFALPVTTSFLELSGATGRLEPSRATLFDLEIGPLVATFLFLSAGAHLLVALPFHRWYLHGLERRVNAGRWIEYTASSSLMIVAIAMLVGIYDVAALIGLFGLNAVMILCGWAMELANERRATTSWSPYWVGCVAGAVPWIAIGVYLVGSGIGPGGPPGFVYGIYGSIFAFFNVFALNMVLQVRGVGRWRSYLYGERVYILLSLTAKSALAWQVFAGTLRPV